MKLDLGNTTLASTGDAGTSAPSYTMDLLAAPFRGIEGLAHGIYNLADWVTFDMLPNWDEGRVFGRSETTPGMLLEGLVQFAVPFGAIGKGISVAGKAARASKSTGLLGKGAKALTKKGTGKFFDLNWKGALATEMATDFVAWDGQEQRLSNLIQQFPALQNPVTQFLAADPDDNEAYGRAKNVLEGMLIGAGLTALFAPVMAGLRALKKRRTELEAGASDEDAIISATVEHADAMREARVFMDDASRLERRESADEFDDIYRAADGDPEDFVEMDLANTDWDKAENATAMSREEFEAIEAGGRVIDEVETDTAVIKKYKFENGSTQTVKIDKINPLDISAFPKQTGMWAEEALTDEEVLESTGKILGLIKKGESKLAVDMLGGLNNSKVFSRVYKDVNENIERLKNKIENPVGEDFEIDPTSPSTAEVLRKELETLEEARKELIDLRYRNSDVSASPEGIAELSMRNIEGQPIHPIMQRIEEGKSTVSDIVSDLEKTFPDSPFISLMRKLKTAIGGDAKITGMDELAKVHGDQKLLTELKETGRSAALRHDDGKMTVGINKEAEAPIEQIMHESVHAVTLQKMHPHLLKHGLLDIEFTDVAARATAIDALLKDKSVPKAVKNYAKIIKFLDTVADEVSAKSGLLEVDYWRDPRELITLGLSNRQFGNALKGINYTEDKTLWQSLIDAIKSLLGIRPNHKANTAFDALVKAGDDLFALKAQEPRRTADTAVDVAGSADFDMADNFEFTGLRRVGDRALGEDLANKIKTENKSDFINISRKDAIGDLDAEGFQQHDPLVWEGANKPVGLWFAQGADWLKFIDQKMPNIAKHAHQLDLNWDSIIKVDKDSLAGFESKYGVDSPDGRLIDWRKVAEDWSGVWVKLDGIESDWTKGWDLSSGAVWENPGLKNSKYLGGASQEPRRTADTAFDVAGSQKVKKTIENVDAKLETGGEQAIRQTGSGMAKSGPTIEGGLRQDEMYEVIRQTGERLNEKGIKPAKHGEEASAEEVGRQLARYTGADGKTIEGMIAAAKDNPEKLAEIETNMNALRSLMASNAEDIVDLAHRFADERKNLPVEELEILEARIKNAVEMQFNLQASVSQIASGFGRGLRATRYKARRIGLSEAELTNEALRQEYLRKRGSLSIEDVVNKIILARDKDGGGDIWDHLVNVNKEIRDMEGGKFMSMLREAYIGSLLFGPRTSVINTMGNSIAGNIKQFERYVGGWLSAEPAVRKGVIDSMSYSIFSKQLWEFVSNVWRNGDSLLDAGGSSFKGDRGNERVAGAITGENFAQSIDALRGTQGALEGRDTFKSVIDFIGKVMRFPMKVLVSTDEMYKQLEFRRRAWAQLTHKAMTDLGMTDSKQISEYVVNTMEALVTSTGRAFSEASLVKEAQGIADNMKFESAVEREMFMADKVEQLRNEKLDFARQQGLVDSDNNINALEQLANEWVEPNLESARVATFTNELGPVSRRVSELVEVASQKNIPGWLFLPFIKAPTNILKFGFSRLGAPATALGQFALSKPFPGLSNARDSYLKALKSPDPIKRAEARGKLATGVVAWTALYTAISNTDKITGGGPLDPRQNKAWRAAGFMPYSIKVNDTWVSYQRLDPVATLVGTIADLVSVVDDNQHGYDKDMMERAVSASMISISRNLTNKSYLSGINNFMQALIEPEISATSVIGRTMAGFIPNFLSQGQSITGDQTIKEARTIWDHTLKKLPFGADRVDLKRNVLGEAAKADMFETIPFQILNPFNPIAWSSKTNDPVLREMAYLHHGFSQPSHMLNRLVNLTEYTQSNGRTAYDRWLELTSEVSVRNNTLRQALEKLIKSNQYQRLAPESSPGLPSPRVKLLNRVISQYRQEALDQLFKEFPDIKYQYDQTVVAKQSLRQGSSFEDVLQLLNQ